VERKLLGLAKAEPSNLTDPCPVQGIFEKMLEEIKIVEESLK